jgi:DNA-binding Lrp family transcriptional regulator
MSGNEPSVVLTTRDRLFLEALGQATYLDRDQFREISGRKAVSVSTANIRLAKLLRGGVIKRFYVGTHGGGSKAIYVLSKDGAALVGARFRPLFRRRASVMADQSVYHQLGINEIFLSVKFRALPQGFHFVRWQSFSSVISKTIPLMPDGYFELNSGADNNACFVEVDRGTEPHKTWKKKIEQYLQLAASGEFERLFGLKRFRVLVVAESGRRLLQIRQTVAQFTHKIFWFATLTNIHRHGLFAACWLRSVGDEERALF